MKALAYLMVTRIKNRILSLKKKPAMLVLYLFIAACIAFSVIILLIANKNMKQMNYADERILLLILSGLGLLYLWIFTNSGLSTGSSLFTMPDVGLLFVAPISSKKILFYGLINTLGKSLLGSIFIFYQIGNLKSNFGYGIKEIVALFLIFALMVMFCQLLAIGIYIFSNGDDSRKRLVRTLLYTLFGVIMLGALLLQKQEQVGLWQGVLKLTEENWFGYLPVAGWVCMFFQGVVHSSIPMILIPIILFLVAGAMIVSLLTMGTADYYEDVLVSTETTFQTLSAAKEGRSIPKANARKIKVRDHEQGIKHGMGANTFLYKHILELRRKSRFVFVDNYTILLICGVGAAGYFFHKRDLPSEAAYFILGTAVYMQFIFSMMGKLKTELLKPYIFLIPEESMKKVFAASLSSFIKHGIDGILMFFVLTLFGGTDPLTGLLCAIAYTSSGAVFVALTILYQRVLGGQPNKLVQMFLSVGLLIAVMGPAIGVSVVAAILLPSSLDFLCTLPFSVLCMLIAALVLVACGNLIDKTEYTGKS